MSAVKNLLALLESMKGQEPGKMNQNNGESFRAVTLQRFQEATAFLADILANVSGTRNECYLSAVVPPNNSICDDWVCTYMLTESDHLEQYLGDAEMVRTLAAMVPPIALKLDLFSEAHHPGYSHTPHVLLRLECHDEPALTLFELAMTSTAPLLQDICEASDLFRVVSFEGACVDIVRPKNIATAIAEGAAAVRSKAAEVAANELSPFPPFFEGFSFEIIFNAATLPHVISEGIRLFMIVFDCVVQELQGMRIEQDLPRGNKP